MDGGFILGCPECNEPLYGEDLGSAYCKTHGYVFIEMSDGSFSVEGKSNGKEEGCTQEGPWLGTGCIWD
jgi:hypothetical protein